MLEMFEMFFVSIFPSAAISYVSSLLDVFETITWALDKTIIYFQYSILIKISLFIQAKLYYNNCILLN